MESKAKGQKLSLAKIISQLIMLYTLHYNRYVKADTQKFNWTEQNNSSKKKKEFKQKRGGGG